MVRSVHYDIMRRKINVNLQTQQTSMSACLAMEVVLRTVQTPMEATFAHVRLAIC